MRTLIQNEVGQDDDGHFEFCHHCQRAVYFAGSVNALLARDLEIEVVSKYREAKVIERTDNG